MRDLINPPGELSTQNPLRNGLLQISRLVLKALLHPLHKLELVGSRNNALRIRNAKCKVGKFEQRFGFDYQHRLYFVRERGKTQYFYDRKRGFTSYAFGLIARSTALAKSYFIDTLGEFKSNDIIVDCGANYGDLFHAFSNTIAPQNYIAIEPGPQEYKCLRLNVPSARLYNLGLGNRIGTFPFYIFNEDGNADSSFIEPEKFSSVQNIDMITLDKLVNDLGLKEIRLLKIEAEGAELEVLQGAKQNLRKICFIAIDGGFERGVNKEETLTSCTNWLIRNNFCLVKLNTQSMKALYRRNDG